MARRKEIKFRHAGRGTMEGRQDGVIYRIYHPWDCPENDHTVSTHDTKNKGRTINTAGHKSFTYKGAVEFCQQIAAGEIDPEAAARLVSSVKEAWQGILLAFEPVAEAFRVWIRSVAAEVAAHEELEKALRWASIGNRPLYNRYHHTKKKRTRKKYAKRILAWYREEVLEK